MFINIVEIREPNGLVIVMSILSAYPLKHRLMGTFRHLVIVILVLLLLAYGKAGTGVSISRKADSIQIVLNENQLVFPGETFRIGVTSYSKNGKVKNTSGLISQLMKNNCHTK